MSDSGGSRLRGFDNCGCCEGLGASTPQRAFNRPALSAVEYRTGTYSKFLASMLARLTSADLPALAELRTRDKDDFSIALLKAWAMVSDVLTFYQERIANESFLRTGTERRSLLELARLIGYPLRPGVAADTYLKFTLEEAPGAPQLAEATITVDAGTKVQSVPGQDEEAQTFETVEAIEGRVAWNTMKPQTSALQLIGAGTTELFLLGTSTLLEPGDAILIVDHDPETNATNMRWDFRLLQTVETDEDLGRTRVTWASVPGQLLNLEVNTYLKVYALRQRASLFGHNAPDPSTLNLPEDTAGSLVDDVDGMVEWQRFRIQDGLIDLDAVYPKVVANSWIVLAAPDVDPALFRVNSVAETTRSDYAMSAKVTRIYPDATPNEDDFGLRETAIYAQSEERELSEAPLGPVLCGDQITLSERVEGLSPKQLLAVHGARLKVEIAGNATGLHLVTPDGSSIPLEPHDVLEVVAAPVLVFSPDIWEVALNQDQMNSILTRDLSVLLPLVFLRIFVFPALTIRWPLRDRDSTDGQLESLLGVLATAAEDGGRKISEVIAIDNDKNSVVHGRDRTTLDLAGSLANIYDRHTVTINANVAKANHGDTVEEVLGSGDASSTYQTFTLKQTPLTYVSAATASGANSTLKVRVNDVLWHEVPTLYGRGPDERIYVTRRDDDGYTSVQFGDGVTGARLPTGQGNVVATYRKGIGLDGLVDAGKLTQLMSRPLGLKEATNPLPAENAEDSESRDAARENAPLKVLTLDRTVSLQDYEDFTRAYAGIAKAHADWMIDGDGYGVFITVAGPGGAKLSSDSQAYSDLLKALATAGDPHTRIRVESYRDALFHFGVRVGVDPDHLDDVVLSKVESALRTEFSFDRRSFGQPVMLSEVIATVQAVPGVVAVDVDALYRDPSRPLEPRLLANMPEITPAGETLAAELLILDPGPLDKLEVMK